MWLENCTLKIGSTSNPCSCNGKTAHLLPTYPETTCDWMVKHRPVDVAVFIAEAEVTQRDTRCVRGGGRRTARFRGNRPEIGAPENADDARTGTARDADGAVPIRKHAATVAVAMFGTGCRPGGGRRGVSGVSGAQLALRKSTNAYYLFPESGYASAHPSPQHGARPTPADTMLAAGSTTCSTAVAFVRAPARVRASSRRPARRLRRSAPAAFGSGAEVDHDDVARTKSARSPAASLVAFVPACFTALTAFGARALESVDENGYPTMYVPPGYVPSPLEDGDGLGQMFIIFVCAVCGFVGMKLSLDSEQAKSEEALGEKVAKQVKVMRAATSGFVVGQSVVSLVENSTTANAAFDNHGLLRLDAAISKQTAAALLKEVNDQLAFELARAGGSAAASDAFGNVYCKGERYDLKLKWGGAGEAALREAVSAMAPFLDAAAGGLFIIFVCAVCGFVGMKLSLDSEQAKSEEALGEKVAKQVKVMRAATSGFVVGQSVVSLVENSTTANAAFDNHGLLRLDAAISKQTAAALLKEVNDQLAFELARAGGSAAASDAFGNVYCKGERYDLKLKWGGAGEAALREAVSAMAPFLDAAAGGREARLCEFAALVSDPGSKRQPIHPDTNYRRDRCVVTAFVALQDVDENMGPTFFIPGSHTASAHLAFREAGETGGAALAAPHQVAILSAGDTTVFDSRLLHCGGGNASQKRRVLFYFSFEVAGRENPNASVSTIREELRGKVTLGDLCA